MPPQELFYLSSIHGLRHRNYSKKKVQRHKLPDEVIDSSVKSLWEPVFVYVFLKCVFFRNSKLILKKTVPSTTTHHAETQTR